jgi:hypothetical protein
MTTSKERLLATLHHQQPDRVCVDFGSTFVTGMHASAVSRLRREVLGDEDWRVKVNEPYQMLGEVDDQLREKLGIDVIGVMPRLSIFGTASGDWKPFTMFDGTEVLVSGDFVTTVEPSTGDLLIYPEGDQTVGPSGRMPKGGFFFDSVIRQDPVDEAKLDPMDNCEDFGLLNEQDLAHYREQIVRLDENPDLGVILIIPGVGFGDIALVPAPFLKHPKGIRDVEEWYISTALRPDYVKAVFDKQLEIGLQNIDALIALFGDRVQAALITGTDFGTQRGPFVSTETYRDLYKPYHAEVNRRIHEKSNWKTFMHSCGSVIPLIPEFIEAGFDILNPVQCSALDMDARRLKQEFGDDIVFWGGGVDTQKTIAFGTPEETYREVRERIEIFNENGGFVFNSIHNVQGNTPTENILAMFRAINDSRLAT